MSRISQLQEKRTKLLEQANAILDASTDGLLSKEQDESFNNLKSQIDQVNAAIKREELIREEELKAKPIGGDANPTAHNNTSPANANVKVGNDLAGQKPFESMGEMLQAIAYAAAPEGYVDPRLRNKAAASGMNSNTPSDGGFLVQTDYSTQLLDQAYDQAQLAPLCTPQPIGPNSDGIELPYVDETSRATGSRSGGVRVYRAAEAAAVEASKPKLGTIDIRLADMKGLCYITERLLNDAVALESFISREFSKEFAFKIDDEIIRGSGAGECLGILNSGALVTVDKESGQAADTILFENVSKMRSRMPGKYRKNAVWLVNQDCEPQLESMTLVVGTGGVPVYMPASGISVDGYDKLYSNPVIPMEQSSALGDVGDILYVNPKEYMVISKGGLKMASSVHVRFIYDEMTFKFSHRVNGQPLVKSAVTPYKGSGTRSPFIALQAR